MSRRRPLWLVFVMLAGVSWSTPAQAQTVEVAGGAGLAIGSSDGTFDSRYAPPFPFVEHTSLATQRLVLQRDGAPVLWASLTWFPAAHVGLEGRVDYRRTDLHGVNGLYIVSVRYIASQPPDFVPREYSLDSSSDWSDTTGHAGQLTATAALVLRVGKPTRTTLRLMGGGGLTTVRGRFEPVGHTTFGLGGHSVLVADDHRLSMRFGSTTAIGVAAGAEVHLPMGGHAAAVVGWRLLIPRQMDLPVVADGLAAANMGINVLQFDDVQRTLAPSPIHWRPVTSDVTLGIAVRF
jgi:hypothetical protein